MSIPALSREQAERHAMDLLTIVRETEEMRMRQRAYFRDRSKANLEQSIRAERRVDEAIRDLVKIVTDQQQPLI